MKVMRDEGGNHERHHDRGMWDDSHNRAHSMDAEVQHHVCRPRCPHDGRWVLIARAGQFA